jgi:opacity protein-like surface antigen
MGISKGEDHNDDRRACGAFERKYRCAMQLYVGTSAGFGVGDTEERYIDNPTAYLPDYTDMNGQIIGLYVDYNFTNGPIVFGVEAAINATNIDGHFNGSEPENTTYYLYNRKADWYGTVTGRVGYAAGNLLYYTFAGAAWTKLKSNWTDFDPTTNISTTYSDNSDHFGWTAGVGLEWAMDPCWVARVEYSHVDFNDESIFEDSGFHGHHETTLDFDAIKVGISYKLRGREEAVVEMPMK